ncbi:ABC transporter permease [Labilibaculum sp. K2S]|uniref:ABC transporter permease n=1 Tax=Labilibaculum sp. K2S TaxID=3056386 RepID=UPI0025A407B7|nr:ABC transporter permease [Labilibaculum sp. K2S]MDM8159182.1 ABC transporter permease [Labilibaculum sp. K2S]
MIKNYFKIAFANLVKSKAYSLISIVSLTIGLAVSVLLLIYVLDELSFDRYHDKADHIYRLCQEQHPYQSPQTAKYLDDNLPEIKSHARILSRPYEIIQYKELRFKENKVAYVDPALFQIFSFKFLKGNPYTALDRPATIVISEKIAQKYFGNANPIGQTFRVNNKTDYTITGVIADIPHNSHFRYEIFATLADANTVYGVESMNSWGWQNFLVYFEMQDEFSKPDVEAKIGQILRKAQNTDPDSPLAKYTIQPLKDIHLYSSHFLGDIQPQNSITYILIFSTIGLLILLIACFNYINLLTANATTRVTEIGIRKTFGASRNQLAMQFISESIVVFMISLILALAVVKISLPIFNSLSEKELFFSILFDVNISFGILGIMLIVIILAGWYPAFILSSFNPIKILKASKSSGRSKFQFKTILVGTQFTIVIALIACAIIMSRQINLLQQKELGFNKESVLLSVVDFGDEEKYNTLKETLLNQSFVSSVSSASRVPSGSLNNEGGVLLEGRSKNEATAIAYVHVNFDYFETLGINAAQGRLFSNQFKTDKTEAVILNEAAVKKIGINGDPIGLSLQCNWPQSKRTIVGVIDDINFESLYDRIKPIVFVIKPDECSELMIKIKPSSATNHIQSITQICEKIYPDQVFDFHFLDASLDQLYQKDKKTFQLLGYFSALAIILACMGLFGMASFILTRRIKEIGIRKVNGAKTYEVIAMLNKDFLKWVIIAFVIACPIAWYAMNKWLENFAYKTELSWWIFALAGLIAMGIALLTVSFQSWRAATRNPVESLRYE